MKRAAIAIATMIGATVLAHYGLAQQPGAEGRTEQTKKGRGRGGFGPAEAGSDLSKPPLPKDDGEKKILEALDEARQGRRYANVSTADGRLLRQLTEAVNAKRVVELGTSTGESGLWFAMALRKTGGHLYTHDIDPGRIAVARENFKKGWRRGPHHDRRGRRPPDRDEEHRPDRRLVHRRREGGVRCLPEGAAPVRPTGRSDPRPQHAAARPESALRRGDHHQPRPRHVVRAHGRRRDRDHAQEALRLLGIAVGVPVYYARASAAWRHSTAH